MGIASILALYDVCAVNYKDALAITGSSPVVRKFPMVPGMDLAGTAAAWCRAWTCRQA